MDACKDLETFDHMLPLLLAGASGVVILNGYISTAILAFAQDGLGQSAHLNVYDANRRLLVLQLM